ncbi:MAG: hypothetical protein IPK74_20745 [Deltaproteobacteria bacterium]|nr:hypothetical protein [Deltaproteobacteria bacterium]
MEHARHVRLSLGLLAIFLASGLWLEAMIGLRAAGWVDDPLRREFLRLGHAHGGLLALVNLVLAWAMTQLGTPATWAGRVRRASLLGAALVGGGFMGGGLWHAAADPGPLVLVVPAGAMMLLASVVAVAAVAGTAAAPPPADDP